jgi:hypothetical protein
VRPYMPATACSIRRRRPRWRTLCQKSGLPEPDAIPVFTLALVPWLRIVIEGWDDATNDGSGGLSEYPVNGGDEIRARCLLATVRRFRPGTRSALARPPRGERRALITTPLPKSKTQPGGYPWLGGLVRCGKCSRLPLPGCLASRTLVNIS